jgi:hypothetical protein
MSESQLIFVKIYLGRLSGHADDTLDDWLSVKIVSPFHDVSSLDFYIECHPKEFSAVNSKLVTGTNIRLALLSSVWLPSCSAYPALNIALVSKHPNVGMLLCPADLVMSPDDSLFIRRNSDFGRQLAGFCHSLGLSSQSYCVLFCREELHRETKDYSLMEVSNEAKLEVNDRVLGSRAIGRTWYSVNNPGLPWRGGE